MLEVCLGISNANGEQWQINVDGRMALGHTCGRFHIRTDTKHGVAEKDNIIQVTSLRLSGCIRSPTILASFIAAG